jgi:Flp pilus assembly protein TadG
MRKTMLSLVRTMFNDQRGQVLPVAALLMVALIGVSGLVVDVGHAYVIRGQLQNSANAAALAAAGYVYDSDSGSVNTTTQAEQYSASTGDKNAYTGLNSVATTVTTKCLNMLMPKGQSCVSGSAANAVRVVNSTNVPTFFMGLFGVPSLKVGATATASMQGASHIWNVAVIIDSTGSMATADSDCGGITEFQCALSGTQALLEATNPCPSGVSSCSGESSNIRVSLFTFPNVLTSYNGTTVNSVSDDINCGGTPATWTNYSSQPIAAPYT